MPTKRALLVALGVLTGLVLFGAPVLTAAPSQAAHGSHIAPAGPKPPKTTTTPPATTTPPVPPAGCTGVAISPGMDVQAAINANPNGTTFCFASGVYAVGNLVPKPSDIFIGGNKAAVLDGGNVRTHAFLANGAGSVEVRQFTIQNFRTPLQEGAIHAFGAVGWVIADNHITRNAATAVATDTGAIVVRNLMDYNGQQGYAAHGSDLLYNNNEIAFNNQNLAVDATWEAGGGKAWDTQRARFEWNNVHDNGGPGMWDDTNNIDIVYENNTVERNWGPGIYHEIGYNARIVGNTVRGNGMPSSPGGGQRLGWMWDAGIQLRSSQGLDPANPTLIANNIVDTNYNAISLIDSPATGCTGSGEGRYGPCKLDNILVRDNTVTMTVGATGVVQDGAGSVVFSRNIHFQGNNYHAPATHPNDGHAFGWFAWADTWPNFSGWQSYGHDLTGTFGP